MGYYDRYDSGYGRPPRRDRFDRNDRYSDQPRIDFKYKVSDVCRLKANPDVQVTIVRIGREQYECRMPDLRTIWFYEHELIDA